jgi:thiol-disulfide isomerase/thioredoxin
MSYSLNKFFAISLAFMFWATTVGISGCRSKTNTSDESNDSGATTEAGSTDSVTTGNEQEDTLAGTGDEDTLAGTGDEDTLAGTGDEDTALPPIDTETPLDVGKVAKYKGGWPENPNADEISDPGWKIEPGIGKTIPRYIAVDQYGDMVDLYDFAGTGKPVVLDVGTWFCKPCKAMAVYFATGDPTVMDEYPWWQDSYEVVKDLIDNEEIYWITVLYSLGTPVDQEGVALWHETFPNEHIPVLADTDLQLKEFLQVKAMPHIAVLDSDMHFLVWTVQGPTKGMKWLVEYAKGL